MSRLATLFLALVLACSVAAGTRAGAPDEAASPGHRLLMIESPTCPYCRAFFRDLAPVYARSPEGRAVPLTPSRLGASLPEGVVLASPALVTPTFILLGPDGAELGRLIGYGGPEMFWSQLDRMLGRAGVVIPEE